MAKAIAGTGVLRVIADILKGIQDIFDFGFLCVFVTLW
jgi:hypothetical protein